MKNHRSPKEPTPGVRRRLSSDSRRPASFSYYANRNDRHEKTNRQQVSMAAQRSRLLSLRFWLRRSGMVAALIVVVVCIISVLSLSNKPRIVVVDQTATDAKAPLALHSVQEYEYTAREFLSASVWNKNKVTVDTTAVADQMKQAFPELAHVGITLPLVGHRPIVYLYPSMPSFTVQAVSGTYVLDERGKILINKDALAPSATSTLLPLIDQSGVPLKVGKRLVSGQKAQFMQDIVTLLAAQNVPVQELILPARGAQELDVRLQGLPYRVKFNMDGVSVRQQVGTFLATKERLAGENKQPSEYIDVRVLGRAYYK